MKRLTTYLLAFWITLMGLHVQAQTTSTKSRWGAGVFAGLNYSYPLMLPA